MQERQKKLLKLIIEHYIQTAEPIGSKLLVEKSGLKISAPTVRNEMRVLEQAGFLMQPHTSAGRVPTESGYAFYIDEIMQPFAPKAEEKQMLLHAGSDAQDRDQFVKRVTKQLAEVLDIAVMTSLNRHQMYYAGISSLFAKPEFKDHAHTVHVSHIFDQCEHIVEHCIGEEIVSAAIPYAIRIGEHNPFSKNCGAVLGYAGPDSIITILGPLRMDYARAVGSMQYILPLIRQNN